MDKKKLEEFMKRKTAEKVIKGYLATKKLKEDGNEYIKMMYKINASKYEVLYNALDDELKAECEEEIRKEIEDGKLNLDQYLAEMHKEKAKKEEEKEEER